MMLPSIEPILRRWRMQPLWPYFPYGGTLVDIGCDVPPLTINTVKERMKQCIGIDAVAKPQKAGNVEIRQQWIEKKLDVESEVADVVTMLAVLEHLDYPEAIARELFRILKPSGVLLLTVPSPANKPILELFAKIGLVRQDMIDQHKNYFTPERLKEVFTKAGFRTVEVKLFQLGLNTFMRAVK